MKFKELPTDPMALKALLQKLKDKEMRLEADLAIKEHPEVEDAIVRLALAIADVKKIDGAILKADKPETEEGRKQLEGLVNRIRYLENNLAAAKQLLRESHGGTIGERYVELKKYRDMAKAQLQTIYQETGKIFAEAGLDLDSILPSVKDYLEK